MLVLFSALLLLAAGCVKREKQEELETKDRQERAEKYLDLAPAGMEFVGCGKEGLLTRVDMDGKAFPIETDVQETLNGVCEENGTLVAVGDQGNIFIWVEDQAVQTFHEAEGSPLYDVVNFQGNWIAVGAEGIWCGSQGRDLKQVLTSDEKYVSVACSQDICIGLREDGVLSISEDGTNWTPLDFNAYYEQNMKMQQILYGGDNFYLLGEEDGVQKIYVSALGNVWSERMLDMLEGEPADLSEETFVGMVWDGQEVVVGCKSGKLLTLPDCTECNKLEETELEEISDIAYCGGYYLLVDPKGESRVIAQDDANVRQYKISLESARQKPEAQFVDVRSREEFEAGHIPGSIHLEVDRIEELPEYIPNKEGEIIFCCTKGIRSKTALEKAVEMGYQNVFYMGDVEAW